MEMQKIEGSSLIAATGHDAATNRLRVEFTDGAVHEYEGVPAEAHERLRSGGDNNSVGKTFHAEIRNAYPSTKVEAEQEGEGG